MDKNKLIHELEPKLIKAYLDDPNAIIKGGLFNINDFNKVYEIMKEQRKKILQENDITELNKLNEEANIVKKVQPYEQNIYEILVGIKNTINGIIYDLINNMKYFTFNIDIFYKNDRLFYIGLIFIIIAILLFLFDLLFKA